VLFGSFKENPQNNTSWALQFIIICEKNPIFHKEQLLLLSHVQNQNKFWIKNLFWINNFDSQPLKCSYKFGNKFINPSSHIVSQIKLLPLILLWDFKSCWEVRILNLNLVFSIYFNFFGAPFPTIGNFPLLNKSTSFCYPLKKNRDVTISTGLAHFVSRQPNVSQWYMKSNPWAHRLDHRENYADIYPWSTNHSS
jgi:hypothetical protein